MYQSSPTSRDHFLSLKKFFIFQVVVVERFISITPSLPIDIRKPLGGGGGVSHMKRQGMLIENLN